MNIITKKIPFMRFHKSEFRLLVKEVLAVVNQFTPLIVFIKTMFDRLKVADEQLDTLEVRYGKHPDTTELVNVRTKSLNLMKSILSYVKSLKQANLESEANDVDQVNTFVTQYLKPIVKADWSDRTFNLDKMFAALSSDTNLQTAIEKLNLKLRFDELQGLMVNQDSLKKSRKESLMRRKKVNTAEIRTEATINLQELFAAIELAQIEHPELDFSEMINGINQSVEYYTTQAKNRSTRNKKKPGSQNSTSGTSNSTNAA